MKTIYQFIALLLAISLLYIGENAPQNSPIDKGIESLGMTGMAGFESLVDSLNIKENCGGYVNSNPNRLTNDRNSY